MYATFTTEVHIIDHVKEEKIRSVLKKQVLTREHGNDKGARPPPVPPVERKPKIVTPLENTFRDLQVSTAEQRDADVNAAEQNNGVVRKESVAKTSAKRK